MESFALTDANTFSETTTLLQHLGRPLAPLSTLPPPALPIGSSTPSKLSHSSSSDDDDDSGSAPHMLWSREKTEQSAQQLGNLLEELVRTEKSYLSRIVALKNVRRDFQPFPPCLCVVSIERLMAELCRPIAQLRQTRLQQDHPHVRGQNTFFQHRRPRPCLRGIPT